LGGRPTGSPRPRARWAQTSWSVARPSSRQTQPTISIARGKWTRIRCTRRAKAFTGRSSSAGRKLLPTLPEGRPARNECVSLLGAVVDPMSPGLNLVTSHLPGSGGGSEESAVFTPAGESLQRFRDGRGWTSNCDKRKRRQSLIDVFRGGVAPMTGGLAVQPPVLGVRDLIEDLDDPLVDAAGGRRRYTSTGRTCPMRSQRATARSSMVGLGLRFAEPQARPTSSPPGPNPLRSSASSKPAVTPRHPDRAAVVAVDDAIVSSAGAPARQGRHHPLSRPGPLDRGPRRRVRIRGRRGRG
jgi:hypothetical protein